MAVIQCSIVIEDEDDDFLPSLFIYVTVVPEAPTGIWKKYLIQVVADFEKQWRFRLERSTPSQWWATMGDWIGSYGSIQWEVWMMVDSEVLLGRMTNV